MTKLTVFNDIHAFAPYQLMSPAMLLAEASRLCNENCFYIGDNVDMRNCRKYDVSRALDFLKGIELFFDDRFIFGNHELRGAHSRRFIKRDKIILSHGDYEYWGDAKANEFRSHAPGSSALKRLESNLLNKAREAFPQERMTPFFIDNALRLMRDNGCTTYICGHRHPSHRLEYEGHGMRIIVLPRGINTVEIN